MLYAREAMLAADDDPDDAPRPVSLALIGNVPPPPREWIVEGWCAAGSPVLISGHGGASKSLLSAQLAIAIAAGRPFLGLPVRRSRTMLLSTEDARDELHVRLRAVADHVGALLNSI